MNTDKLGRIPENATTGQPTQTTGEARQASAQQVLVEGEKKISGPREKSEALISQHPIEAQTGNKESCSTPAHVHAGRTQRHSKRLSLNFPILIPSRRSIDFASPDYLASPATATSNVSFMPSCSSIQSQNESVASSTASPAPLTPPSESSTDENFLVRRSSSLRTQRLHGHTRSHTLAHTTQSSTAAPDFLTLLASQERRVLELKEELQRAETELLTLKKQWATHEANRKKGEYKAGVVKMGTMAGSPVSPGYGRNHARDYGSPSGYRPGHTRAATMADTAGLGVELGLNDIYEQEVGEAERERRRSLVQDRMMRRATFENPSMSSGGRKTGQRVFSSSRHARALSLLTTNSALPSSGPLKQDDSSSDVLGILPADSRVRTSPVPESDGDLIDPHENQSFMPSLIRTNSGLARELDFRKTYKDLASAASRRSLPPGADVLMKQGRIVVDGVRDGLWNFIEDIRQATVGDEVTRVIGSEPSDESTGKKKSYPKHNGGRSSTKGDEQDSEQSFWREFGVETPRSDKIQPRRKHTNTHTRDSDTRHVRESKLDQSHDDSDIVAPLEADSRLSRKSSTNTTRVPGASSKASKQKKDHEHHESKSSTDSRDSRDSRNPPSLLSDVPSEERDNHTDDGESWEWGEIESPRSVKKVGFVGVSKMDRPDQASDQHQDRSKEVFWHELSR